MDAVGVPLLASKLHAPRRRPGLVHRPQLLVRLDHRTLPAVVLVSAPAGFGKTTLLAEWLRTHEAAPTAMAWVSLTRRDSDPVVYWSYVLTALRTVVPDLGANALAALQTPAAPLDDVVAALLNDVVEHDHDVVLVLDDYHLIESVDVHESMLFLLEHLPEQLHLVVASRADPPWPLARLRTRGELLEIRAVDLRFTSEEAAAYLTDAMGLDLTARDIESLEARTEGWIAALQLAALSLRGRDDPARFIAEFAGNDRFVVDYLVDEVLDRQPDPVREFLLQTSILTRLSGPLCRAVTGDEDARSTLEVLERSNLFLIALDDRRQWFRYHHLFAEVLRARLADERGESIPQLHRRACDWFDAAGDRGEAIAHALAAEDFPKAAELIELAVPDLRRARQDATQRRWLDALPRRIFKGRPVLSIELVGAHMATGDVEGVEELLADVERWLDPDHPTGEMTVHAQAEFRRLPGQAAMYRAGLALLGGDLAGAAAHGERAADLSGTEDHLGRGAAAALIGLAQWSGGHLERAARQYAEAIIEFESAGFFADILGCSLGLADIQVARGRLAEAERTLDAGLELAAAHGPLRGTADMHVGLAEVHLERNELAAATERLRASLEVGEQLALGQHAYRWRVVDARLLAIGGNHTGALQRLREAERCYDTDYSPKLRPVTATTARVQIAAGNLTAAKEWADRAGITADEAPSYLREYEHLTLARVLLACGRAADALPMLERLLHAAEVGGRDGTAVEAGGLLALAHQGHGDQGQALARLGDALTRAAPERFARVFLDLGAPMTALLTAAVRHDRNAAQAGGLLAADATPASIPPRPDLLAPLTNRELEVLRLLRTDLTGPAIAGELVVSLNTVRTHTKNIFTKLGVTNRRSAVRRAGELGL